MRQEHLELLQPVVDVAKWLVAVFSPGERLRLTSSHQSLPQLGRIRAAELLDRLAVLPSFQLGFLGC